MAEPSSAGGRTEYATWTTDGLLARYVELEAREAAVRAERLEVLAVIEAREAFKVDGAASIEGWLADVAGKSHRSAAKEVAVARRLPELPELADAIGAAEISLDVASQVAKFATPESAKEVVDEAKGWSPTQAARVAAKEVGLGLKEASYIHESRFLSIYAAEGAATVDIKGRLDCFDGEVLRRAIEAIVSEEGVGEATLAQARADALVSLATGRLADSPGSLLATVNVHVDAVEFGAVGGTGEVEDGFVAPALVERLACDASLVAVVEHGGDLGSTEGRARRTVSPKMAAAIRHRDKTCIFKSCSRTRWTNAHHIIHWADGGPTTKENLVLLCTFHHKAIHEGGWRLEGNPYLGLKLTSPAGEVTLLAPRSGGVPGLFGRGVRARAPGRGRPPSDNASCDRIERSARPGGELSLLGGDP